MTPAGVVRCGRIDDHEGHHWIRPSLFGKKAASYWCAGRGVIEGGSR